MMLEVCGNGLLDTFFWALTISLVTTLGSCGEVAPSRMMSRFLACQVAINTLSVNWKLVEAVTSEILANMMTSARCTSSMFRLLGAWRHWEGLGQK